MRCRACNVALNNYEATRKTFEGEFIDLCNACFYTIRKEVNCANNVDTDIIIEDSYDLISK